MTDDARMWRPMSLEAGITVENCDNIRITPSNNKPLLVFYADGRVTADPDLKPDEAARELISLLVRCGWFKFLPT